jgi:signal transduction histidine kinase
MLIFINMGLVAQVWGQCTQIDSLKRVKFVLEEKKDTRGLVKVYNRLSEAYLSTSKLLSLDFANQAVSLAKNLNLQEELAQAYINRGIVQYQYDPLKFDSSVKDFEQALSIYKKRKNKETTAQTYAAFAKFYYDISYSKKDYLDSAAKYYTKSYDLYEKNGKSREAAEIAGFAAEVYFEKNDEQKALDFSNKSINSNDIQFSKANIIKRSLDAQLDAQRVSITIGVFALLILAGFTLLLVRQFWQVRQANALLEKQKTALVEKNNEIEQKKSEIEKQNVEIQAAFRKVEAQNKEIERQNREILLQQTEIEMRNAEMGEKNEELKQQQEEILTQRDTLENQAHELAEKAGKLQKSYETITILSRIGQTITSSLNFQEILNTFYLYTTQLMPGEGFVLAEYHLENNLIDLKFNREFKDEKPLSGIPMEDEANPIVWCIKNARTIWVNDREDLPKYKLSERYVNPQFNSMIFCPLLSDNQAIGAVGVYSSDEDAYTLQHLDMLKTLASYATIAIDNAKTYEILNAAQEQLVEAEKMAALGNLVAGVAHEINTPVGICVTAASRLDSKTKEFAEVFTSGQMKRKDLADYLGTAEEGMKILMNNLTRAADLVQGFKRVAVEQSSETKRVFELKTYLEETILALKPEFKNKPYEIVLDAETIEINGYAGAFSQILTNLVMNSLIHGFKGRDSGQIVVQTRTRNKNLVLTYTENGNGMTKEVLNQIYEPFFTTNRDGGGTGLGMNIVYNLAVQKLGGKLTAESEPGKGVKFVFEIPLNM